MPREINLDLLEEIEFRYMETTDDYIFVLSNWQKSFRNSLYAGTIRNNRYYEEMKNTIDDLIARGMIVIMASNKSDSNQLLGFIAIEKSKAIPVVHYLFVKPDFRGHGLMPMLMWAAGITEKFLYTHQTKYSRKIKNGYFYPGIARRKDLEPCYLPLDKKE